MTKLAAIDSFIPLISALIGGIATGLWNKFNNRRADAGVRRQIHAYAGATFQDLTIVAKSLKVSRRGTLLTGMQLLIDRSHEPDIPIALNQRQATALYEAVGSLVSLQSWFDESQAADTWYDLPVLSREAVYTAVCQTARVLVAFGDDVTVASLTPEAVRESHLWALYVLEPSLIDRVRFLLPLLNWWVRKNHWKAAPKDAVRTDKVRRILGAKWPAPEVEPLHTDHEGPS